MSCSCYKAYTNQHTLYLQSNLTVDHDFCHTHPVLLDHFTIFSMVNYQLSIWQPIYAENFVSYQLSLWQTIYAENFVNSPCGWDQC